ncbi:MAG TPA: intradiol ring-cleavage dioxygenase [Herpetosiphonaceae bacterium]
MDNDDRQIGRILSRREVLTLMGAAGAAFLVGCGPTGTSSTDQAAPTLNAEAQTAAAIGSDPAASATQQAEVATAEAANTQVAVPNCVVRPEVTEGPYYVDVNLIRSDIREQKEGTPLVLTFNVVQVDGTNCTPLEGATVEIWHCDAAGSYSGVSDPGFNTEGQTWLRGAQVTDANGVATFTTIYPGWYAGRAVHIHFKVSPSEDKVFTSQLFFDDTLSQQVFTQAPYTRALRPTRSTAPTISTRICSCSPPRNQRTATRQPSRSGSICRRLAPGNIAAHREDLADRPDLARPGVQPRRRKQACGSAQVRARRTGVRSSSLCLDSI